MGGLLRVSTINQARHRETILGCRVVASYMDEAWRLWHTIDTLWPAIEVLTATGVSNARIEAANTSVKQIKRISANRTGIQKSRPLPSRIQLTGAARRAAGTH